MSDNRNWNPGLKSLETPLLPLSYEYNNDILYLLICKMIIIIDIVSDEVSSGNLFIHKFIYNI